MLGAKHLTNLHPNAAATLLLWRQSLRRPRQVCSAMPSSPFVGAAMAEAIRGRPEHAVIELGAGTGAVTRQLLAHGVNPADLTLVEIDRSLGAYLRATFPKVQTIVASAEQLAQLWEDRQKPKAGAIVSTLPLRLFEPPELRSILANALAVLAPGAPFVQFTYRPGNPVPPRVLAELGLQSARHSMVWANCPPAAIWTYRLQSQTELAEAS